MRCLRLTVTATRATPPHEDLPPPPAATNSPGADFEPPEADPKGGGQEARGNGWGGGAVLIPALAITEARAPW